MASDEIVWDIINHQHCSFKLKTTKDQNFCRNEYNLTGLCTRQNCPLANSRYATVRGDAATGRMYLYIKTVERAHLPSKWWEKIRLPTNYAKALEVIDERLVYWPKFLVHKSKQRLTRLTQVAIRTRRLEREHERLGETTVPRLAPKIRRREATRERKAEAAAKVERTIERELIERLRSGAYGDRPINVEEGIWKKVLRGLERSGEGTVEEDPDLSEDEDEDDELEEEEGEREVEYEGGVPQVEYVSDIDSESERGDLEDLEDWIDSDASDASNASGQDSQEDDDENGEEASQDGEEAATNGRGDANSQLKSALQSLKRKRPATRLTKPSKRKIVAKGPKREIVYESEQPPRVLELA